MRAAAFILGTVSCLAAAHASADTYQRSIAEQHLTERLFAPCCYVQMLDAHDSPLARELRLQIHERLARGESVETIENDLVARFGERIRARPRGLSTTLVGVVMLAATVLLGLGLILRVRRRVRTAPEATVPPRSPLPAQALDWEGRLDDELCALDA